MSTPSSGHAARDRILDAAAQAFAHHGFHAASMRDIARDADCALSLLTHHFGTKREMLKAVVEQQGGICEKRLAGLRSQLARSDFSLDDFIRTWANYEFDLAATRGGRNYLILMLRLQADREVDDAIRSTLNCAQATVIKGFARAWPLLDEQGRQGVWRMASSALYAEVVGSREGAPESAASSERPRRRAISFLLDGLRGYCNCPQDDVVPR